MATMSTASRTAWTSCGVRLTLPKGMLGESKQRALAAHFWSRGAGTVSQGHHRGAVAALVRGAGMRLLHRGVAPQMLADRLAQPAGAMAVDHPHLAPRRQQR